MSNIHYTPDSMAIEISKMIERRREDLDWYNQRISAGDVSGEKLEGYKRKAGYIQSDIITLQAVLRRLEITNDIQMNFIAEDIMERIMAVRKDSMADKFVGIIVYYELKPRYEWREDGCNPVACVSNVKGWPGGDYGMCDFGNGTFSVESDHPGPGCWVLGGQYVPIPCSPEERKEAES